MICRNCKNEVILEGTECPLCAATNEPEIKVVPKIQAKKRGK